MKICDQSISVSRAFPVSVGCLWSAAGHPSRLSNAVAMLRDFSAPMILEVGSRLAETHTILGWPQHYTGRVTRYERIARWAMTSRPQSPGPCPLPHDVDYQFEARGNGSVLTITCDFKCGGLLALPFVPKLVAWFMRRTISNLLSSIADRISNHSVPKTV